jgi:lysophospholipase L1-like esterase
VQTADRRILFFGDSHVLGVGDPKCLGWPGRIARASARAGHPITPYNLGVRGNTTREVADRWSAEAAARLIPGPAYGFVFSFGVNDTLVEDGAGRLEPHQSVAALHEILRQAAARRLPAFVVGPAPVAEDAHSARIEELSERFSVVCDEVGVPFVPIVGRLRGDATWRGEVAADDGAHPAAGGYAMIAETVLAAGWIDWLDGVRGTLRDPAQG